MRLRELPHQLHPVHWVAVILVLAWLIGVSVLIVASLYGP